jgi:hypothetical protein
MKKPIIIILAITGFIAATKLPAPTYHREQLAIVEEHEAELNKVWNELSPSQRDALRADEKRWIAWKDTLGLTDKMIEISKRIDYLKSFLK